jgi:primary-amine oxidase
VLYQGSLAEIFVPYQDPDANWFYKTYMDAGEFGLGLLSSPLALGLDVPSNAVLLNALVSAAIPDPSVPVVPLPLSNVVGVFERLTGNPAWRHFELFSGGLYEGRAEVELVVRSISQVGNYDYMIDWVFSQKGVIRVEVGLTGIDAGRGLSARISATVWARRDAIRPGRAQRSRSAQPQSTSASLDIDGRNNSFMLGQLKTRNLGNNPRKSIWVVDEQRLGRERDAQLDDNNSIWRVINPNRRNARGYNTGYIVESHANAEPLLKIQDFKRCNISAAGS